MPAIYLFDRRTFIGGDDLQPAILLAHLLRLMQLTLLLGPVFVHVLQESNGSSGFFFSYALYDHNPHDDSCRHSHVFGLLLLSYAIASTLYAIGSALLEWRLSYWAGVGSPTQTQPRSAKVSHLLELKLLPFSIVLFLIFVMGIAMIAFAPNYYRCKQGTNEEDEAVVDYYFLYSSSSSSSSSGEKDASDDDVIQRHFLQDLKLWWIATALLLLTQLSDVIVSWMYLLHLCSGPRRANQALYNTSGSSPTRDRPLYTIETEDYASHRHELVEEMWAERCATACQCLGFASCFMFGGREVPTTASAQLSGDHFGDIARALADYMETRGILDVVPSDIVAGFLILKKLQHVRLHQTRQQLVQALSKPTESTMTTTTATATTTTTAPSIMTMETVDSKLAEPQQEMGLVSNRVNLSAASEPNPLGVAEAPLISFEDTTAAIPAPSLTTPMMVDPDGSSINGNNNNNNMPNENDSNNNENGSLSSTTYATAAASASPPSPPTPLSYATAASAPTPPPTSSPPTSSSSPLPRRGLDLVRSNTAQRSVYRFLTKEGTYERHHRTILSRNRLDDRAALDEGARYARYALAIYTWVLYLYVHPVTGIPRLAVKGALACCRRKKRAREDPMAAPQFPAGLLDEHGRIEGDNMCESHKTALLLTAGLEQTDLVYLQLKSGFRHNPYCILLDHEWKCVVVSIRGTFSLEDCVTDVLIEPESLQQIGRDFGFDAENEYCHGGVLLFVRNIYRDLQRHQLLDKLLLGEHAQYPDYTLRLVGHSLGAAACTILSYMLRQRFPTLRCVNYSPPGCSLTHKLAFGCKEWCHSFVLDSDIVPRLSFDAMEAWRDEILEVIGRIKVPKAEVVRRFMESTVKDDGGGGHCGCGGEWCFDPLVHHHHDNDDDDDPASSIEEILYEPHEVPDTEYKRQLDRFKVIQEERRRLRGERRAIKLYPPGKMVHLVKTGEQRACVHGMVKCLTCCTTNYGFDYTPVWINNDDLNEIVISGHMGTDHFPNRMLNVVSGLAAEYGLQQPQQQQHFTTTTRPPPSSHIV